MSKPVQFLAKVVESRLQLDIPVDSEVFPEGAEVTLTVSGIVTDRCRCVFVPGIMNPPGNRMPRVRTRCALQRGHEDGHSFEPV